MSKLTAEQLNELKRLYTELKLSPIEIGKIINRHPHTVGRILKRIGIKTTPKQISLEKQRSILDMYNSGSSLQEIMRSMNIGYARIMEVLEENDISYELRRTNYSEEEVQTVLSLHNQGKAPWQIAEETGSTRNRVAKILTSLNIDCNVVIRDDRDYSVNHNFLDVIDTQEKAYFLGYMMTDGTVSADRNSVRIGLSIIDKHILETFTKWIQPDKPLWFSERNGRDYCTMTIESKQLKSKLIEHGCPPKKTYILTYPTSIPEHLQSHFLRGVLDGDGCIYHNKNNKQPKIVFVGSKLFMEGAANMIFKNTGVNGALYHAYDCNEVIYKLDYWAVRKCQDILNWLYKDSRVHLIRKFDKYQVIKTMTGARV